VTVNEVNNVAPTLGFITKQAVDELSLLTFAANATDEDIPFDPIYSLSGEPAGAVIDESTGVFTWTPSEEQGPGVFVVEVIVTDNGGLTDSQFVEITVDEVGGNPPMLDPIGDKTVDELSLLTFTANATDVDMPFDPIYSLSAGPAGAIINASSGVFTWTPTEAQGPDSFTNWI